MNIADKLLSVRVATHQEELDSGLRFVEVQYLKTFGVRPSPPDYLIIAWLEEDIVGTIGINAWSTNSSLRLQELYRFDTEKVSFPIDLPRTVEFTRWACETSGVACALLLAASCLSLELGMKFVWCEHGLAVNRVCRKYGIKFYDTSSVERDDSRIEDYYLAFYQSVDPRFFIFDLDRAKAGLELYLDSR